VNLQQKISDLNCPANASLMVAASAGVDSTALLHAAAVALPGRVCAVHINHGLQAAAADFEAHVSRQCAHLNVPLLRLCASVQVQPGQSTEDAARRSRYEALAVAWQAICTKNEPLPSEEWTSFAIKNGVFEGAWAGVRKPVAVALAQHADDQLETVLLALSRGGGVAGLAGMPARFERHGVAFVRPWLSASRADIEAYAQEHALTWVDDPTNADVHFTRNRIRAQVVPALLAAFPQARQTFARSAGHAGQAAELLAELAEQDLQAVGNPPALKALQTLSTARQANVVRHWLRTDHQTQASTAQLQELLAQIECATTRGHRIHIKVGKGFVSLQQHRLVFKFE
jgi:tRNA(Ile)-lysidine synthase